MKITVDLGPLTGPELESWLLAFMRASEHVDDPDERAALDALGDAGEVEAIRRRQGGTGSRRQPVVLVSADADPEVAARVRERLIIRVQTYRDAPWIGPRLAEAFHLLLLDLADERDRVRRENEAVRDLIASRYFRGSAPA